MATTETERPGAGHRVVLQLNQQQLELIDRTIAEGAARDRAELVRLALREYAAAHQARQQ